MVRNGVSIRVIGRFAELDFIVETLQIRSIVLREDLCDSLVVGKQDESAVVEVLEEFRYSKCDCLCLLVHLHLLLQHTTETLRICDTQTEFYVHYRPDTRG